MVLGTERRQKGTGIDVRTSCFSIVQSVIVFCGDLRTRVLLELLLLSQLVKELSEVH